MPVSIDDEDRPEPERRCRNQACPGWISGDNVHPIGFCNICCARIGSLNCTTCWPDEDDDR